MFDLKAANKCLQDTILMPGIKSAAHRHVRGCMAWQP